MKCSVNRRVLCWINHHLDDKGPFVITVRGCQCQEPWRRKRNLDHVHLFDLHNRGHLCAYCWNCAAYVCSLENSQKSEKYNLTSICSSSACWYLAFKLKTYSYTVRMTHIMYICPVEHLCRWFWRICSVKSGQQNASSSLPGWVCVTSSLLSHWHWIWRVRWGSCCQQQCQQQTSAAGGCSSTVQSRIWYDPRNIIQKLMIDWGQKKHLKLERWHVFLIPILKKSPAFLGTYLIV